MTALGRLQANASLSSAELLAELRRVEAWAHVAEEDLDAIAAGGRCGPGLLRAWVWACRGSAEDEAHAWADQGWPLDEARELVRTLPAVVPTLRCAAPGCLAAVSPRRRGGRRPGEAVYCSTRCRKAAHRARHASPHASQTTPCMRCGSPVEPRRRGGRRPGEGVYCIDGCRKAAHAARHASQAVDDVAHASPHASHAPPPIVRTTVEDVAARLGLQADVLGEVTTWRRTRRRTRWQPISLAMVGPMRPDSPAALGGLRWRGSVESDHPDHYYRSILEQTRDDARSQVARKMLATAASQLLNAITDRLFNTDNGPRAGLYWRVPPDERATWLATFWPHHPNAQARR